MGIAGFVVLTLVCLLLMIPLRSGFLDSSSKIAQLSANNASNNLAELINGSANVIRAYSGMIEIMTESEIIPDEKKREWLLAQMAMIIKKEKKMSNLWSIFEPNALDGMDSFFVNQKGSNSQGIFAPCFADGKLTVSEISNESAIYKQMKATGREMITEPYLGEVNGKQVQRISMINPITVKGKFIGVVGTDFYTNDLNELIASLNLNTSGKLVTDKGTIAVHRYPERIGTQVEHGNREILDKLLEGKMFEGMYYFEGTDVYKVYNPIQLGENVKPWFYAVDVPKDEIYAQARKTVAYLIIYCIIGVLLITLAGGILIRSMLKDITSVTGIIHQLSLGNSNVHIDSHSHKDEIGKMKNELSKLVGGLKRTADFAHSIGEGNLNAEYQTLSGDDVLGNSLLEMRHSLHKAEKEQLMRTKEEEQRNWGTAGLAKFAEILRHNNDNLEVLSYNIISNMVKYLDANQGGIFLLNEDEHEADKVLEMKACYAFDRKKFTEKQIHPGEGLVGTCYLEGESIYITDVPNNYITITSGLGNANPRAVLICPLKLNDEILGVIELASFQEIEPYQYEFVQKVSQSIAATISSVRINIRTERLLTKTKLQAEEMANQEEELRQNMEEMLATQEEMRRHEDELNETLEKMKVMVADGEHFKDKVHWYEALLDAFIESPISVTDMDKNVTFLNQAALTILGKTREEVIGKKCGCVWGVDICKDERCGIEYLKRGLGKSVFNVGDAIFTTDASYIKDRNGNNIGHIEVVANITETIHKSEYNKKEVEKLAANIAKMAEGDIDCDFTVVQPNEYTQDEYKHYSAISSNLEQVRNTIKNLLSNSK